MNDAVSAERCELIVYATPTGDLAEQCATYFQRVSGRLGGTVAQTYPPHITLTGFFHRRPEAVARVVHEIGAVIDIRGPVPEGAVTIAELRAADGWVGLVIESPWLVSLTAAIVDAHTLTEGDDALRPKDWLHLSLAYGFDGASGSFEDYANEARATVDPTSGCGWQVGVWERTGSPLAPQWRLH